VEEKTDILGEVSGKIPENPDVIIVGTGAAGLFCALHLSGHKNILMITKEAADRSDSFLAQGGICVLKEEQDYDSYFEDTMRAGHYENNKASVETMIRTSPQIIRDLVGYGVEFTKENGQFKYTREGAHSVSRILYHEDLTGKEITGKLLEEARRRKNITIMEYTVMIDLICQKNGCRGVVVRCENGAILRLQAKDVVLASGGIGGLYQDSTNYPHLTGDALALALKYHIRLQNVNYIQIHPTTLYSKKPGRRYLISESVRGEGAYLYNAAKERFVNELLPRDLLTQEIYRQMEREGSSHVWLSMQHLGSDFIKKRFPNIYRHCLEEGYDVTRECIPVVPAQHYFMGGIQVDLDGKTSMDRLYAVGETSCNGVHGANRLASNSLLESLVFAKRAAVHINGNFRSSAEASMESDSTASTAADRTGIAYDGDYTNIEQLQSDYKKSILNEIERVSHEEQSKHREIEYR
jgi:L-aspartate oxidase